MLLFLANGLKAEVMCVHFKSEYLIALLHVKFPRVFFHSDANFKITLVQNNLIPVYKNWFQSARKLGERGRQAYTALQVCSLLQTTW